MISQRDGRCSRILENSKIKLHHLRFDLPVISTLTRIILEFVDCRSDRHRVVVATVRSQGGRPRYRDVSLLLVPTASHDVVRHSLQRRTDEDSMKDDLVETKSFLTTDKILKVVLEETYDSMSLTLEECQTSKNNLERHVRGRTLL